MFIHVMTRSGPLNNPVILRLRLHTSMKPIPIPRILAQRINPNRVLWHLPMLIIILRGQALNRSPVTALHAALPAALRVLEFVREAVVLVDALFGHVDFVADQDGGELRFDHRPEDWGRGADYGEVDFDGGEDDHEGCPPCRIEVGIGRGLVDGDDVEAPD
jgi:hypothetical protein